MLDVGLYRFDQQVACQRYRQQFLDAKSEFSLKNIADAFNALVAPKAPAYV